MFCEFTAISTFQVTSFTTVTTFSRGSNAMIAIYSVATHDNSNITLRVRYMTLYRLYFTDIGLARRWFVNTERTH